MTYKTTTLPMSAKLERRLRDALDHLDRGLRYLHSERVHVVQETSVLCGKENMWVNQLDGKSGVAFEKRIGTELCYLDNARDALRRLLQPPTQE